VSGRPFKEGVTDQMESDWVVFIFLEKDLLEYLTAGMIDYLCQRRDL